MSGTSQDSSRAFHGRKQKRIDVGLTLTVRGTDKHGVPFADSVHTTNISRTGASFHLRREVTVGMNLELEFAPRPGRAEEEFTMSARIVRAERDTFDGSFHLGVQFSRRFLRVYVPESGS